MKFAAYSVIIIKISYIYIFFFKGSHYFITLEMYIIIYIFYYDNDLPDILVLPSYNSRQILASVWAFPLPYITLCTLQCTISCTR